MNWDEVGAIGQVLGSVAVLGTIVYLAIQVRHAREQLVRSERQSRWASTREVFLTQASHPELAMAIRKLQKAFRHDVHPAIELLIEAGLSDAEAVQINSMSWALWTNAEQMVDSIEHQSPGGRTQARSRLRQQYTRTFMATWYELSRDALNPDVVRYIDNLLAQPS